MRKLFEIKKERQGERVVEKASELFRDNPDLVLYDGSICTIIRLLRESKKMSRKDLALIAGIDEAVLKELERGEMVRKKLGPNVLDFIEKLSGPLGFSKDEMFIMADRAFVSSGISRITQTTVELKRDS